MVLLKLPLVVLMAVAPRLYAPTLSVPEPLSAGLLAPRLNLATVEGVGEAPSVTVTCPAPLTLA